MTGCTPALSTWHAPPDRPLKPARPDPEHFHTMLHPVALALLALLLPGAVPGACASEMPDISVEDFVGDFVEDFVDVRCYDVAPPAEGLAPGNGGDVSVWCSLESPGLFVNVTVEGRVPVVTWEPDAYVCLANGSCDVYSTEEFARRFLHTLVSGTAEACVYAKGSCVRGTVQYAPYKGIVDFDVPVDIVAGVVVSVRGRIVLDRPPACDLLDELHATFCRVFEEDEAGCVELVARSASTTVVVPLAGPPCTPL